MSYQEFSTNSLQMVPGTTLVTVTRDITIGHPAGVSGDRATLLLYRSDAGAVTWPGESYRYAGGTFPELPETSGSWVAVDYVKAGSWFEVSRSVYDAAP